MPSSKRTKDEEALAAELAAVAREAAGAAGAEPGAGPGSDELLDYLEDRLSPEAEAALRRRLVASPEATRRLLDLADLTDARAEAEAADEDRPADLAVHAAWRDFERRRGGRPAARRRAPAWLSALAAALLVVLVGLGGWVWRLESRDGGTVANLRSLGARGRPPLRARDHGSAAEGRPPATRARARRALPRLPRRSRRSRRPASDPGARAGRARPVDAAARPPRAGPLRPASRGLRARARDIDLSL